MNAAVITSGMWIISRYWKLARRFWKSWRPSPTARTIVRKLSSRSTIAATSRAQRELRRARGAGDHVHAADRRALAPGHARLDLVAGDHRRRLPAEPDLARDRARRARVVAGDHDRVDPRLAAEAHGVRHNVPHRGLEGEQARPAEAAGPLVPPRPHAGVQRPPGAGEHLVAARRPLPHPPVPH